MNVLLIQSHLGRRKHAPIFPIGLSYIATALSGKQNVKILDLNMWEMPAAFENMEKEILNFVPDVIGISIRNIDSTARTDIFYHFKTIKPTVELIKKIRPDVKLIVGGAGFSLFAQKIMERVPEFDFGIYLEGEDSIRELLDNLDAPESVKGIFIRKDGSVKFTGSREPVDFAKLPAPKRDKNFIDINNYTGPTEAKVGLQSKRGCILKCAYCNYPFLTGNKLRLRPAKDVVDEIEYLGSFGIRQFCFVDNIFNIPKSHAKEICEEIIRRGLKVEWSAWYEVKNATEDLIRLAKEAGCIHFGFSPDALTNKALSYLNKGITTEDIMNNISIFRKIDKTRVGYNFFLMLPGMNLIDVIRTAFMFIKVPILLFGKGGAGLGWIRIEPHTGIHRLAIEEGIVKEDTELFPEDENELKNLFYAKPIYRFLDLSIINFIKFFDGYLKPALKLLIKGAPRKRR